MWLDNESRDAIDYFWKAAGEIESFPRSLERAISLALPVAIIKLPHLALGNIETWLKSRQISHSFNCQSRPVRGCLIAFRGTGFLFCDGSDIENEVRFTIAHEVAHFLVDYFMPRKRALEIYGPSIFAILDGKRKPSLTERVSSLLKGVKIGLNTDLMERERQDDPGCVWRIEGKADKVALELLAPSKDVFRNADLSQDDFSSRIASITKTLTTTFGLPLPTADYYGNVLLRSIGKGPSWTEAIRVSKLSILS